ncbi:MAG TPA: carboxypeptidase-like regulatory domain-containing protein, partial [Terriglobales bacterium]|nr:carboxypeptidase-like regulatory domain-containing protein [Terriglobales bacterium]
MEVNFRRRMSAFAAIFGVLLLLSTSVLAQTTLGRISGVVTDPTGAVVPNAKITATNEETKQSTSTTSSSSGSFAFPQLPVGFYNIKIEAGGLKTASYSKVKVDTGLEYSITAKLEVGAASETVEVVAGSELVNTSTSEISNTVAKEQIRDLPLASRNPLALVTLQAGVPGIFNRTNTAINGARPGWTQVTQDGINIQDNFIRVNGLDFVPNRPTSDNVGEFTITTNNLGADNAGGSSQVKFTTDQGTNTFHGSLYEFNRNSKFAANSWVNNNRTVNTTTPCTVSPDCPAGFVRQHSPLPKPFLNRNQYGGRIGGPIMKNKLFFFGYYERFWEVRGVSQSRTIPLYDALLTGEYRYLAGAAGTGPLTTVNVLTLAGLTPTSGGLTTPVRTVDAQVQSLILSKIPGSANQTRANGASTITALEDFNQSDAVIRNFMGGRADWELNQSNHIELTYKRSTDSDLRNDLDNFNNPPSTSTYATTDFYVGAWRWTINPRMQNEARVGGNLAPVAFINNFDFGSAIYGIPLLTNPTGGNFQPQGRDVRTYQYIDNFSWTRGDHNWAFGGSFQNTRIQPFVAGFATSPDRFPLYNFGYSGAAPCGGTAAPTTCEFLQSGNFPAGISATNLANANALRALLNGVIGSGVQTFEVTSPTSGYVPGAKNVRDLTLNTLDFYAKDSWRIRPNLTLNMGLKWEYWSPLREDNGLGIAPVLNGRPVGDAVLDPTTIVDFVKGDFYSKDLNNFGPSFGFAWDPFSNGKTSLRGGYTLTFVNDETATVGRNASVVGNVGLSSTVTVNNFFNNLSAGAPVLAPTPYKMPRTAADQLALGLTNVFWAIDPNLRTPYVHQFNLSVQRELPGELAVEARYVGTIGHKLFRGVDLNQNKAGILPAFLAEFDRARQNIFSPCAAITGATCPNAATTMPTLVSLGSLTSGTVTTAVRQNAIASLADFYVAGNVSATNAALARSIFLPNTGIYAADVIYNGGDTNYHGLQLEARRRMKNGIFGQVNYTFSKNISNTAGTSQARLEALLDNARPQLEKRVSDFHVAHIVNANMIYELPFGQGKRWLNNNSILNYIVGGWQTGNIIHWQTGSPISIVSARGTFNRGGRSGLNTAVSSLSRGQIQDLFGIFRCGESGVVCPGNTPTGTMFFINPSVTGTNGAAVGADNLLNTPSTAFNQVFNNPTAGQVGNLGTNAFIGPSQFQWDFSVAKKTKITERFNLEFRTEFFNFTNHTNWFVGDQNINGTAFGRLTPGSVNVQERVV